MRYQVEQEGDQILVKIFADHGKYPLMVRAIRNCCEKNTAEIPDTPPPPAGEPMTVQVPAGEKPCDPVALNDCLQKQLEPAGIFY